MLFHLNLYFGFQVNERNYVLTWLCCLIISYLFLHFSTFNHLSKLNEVLNQAMAADEARICQDLLSQAKYHLDRAKSREEQERVVRKRQVGSISSC